MRTLGWVDRNEKVRVRTTCTRMGLEDEVSLAWRVTLSHIGTPFYLQYECHDIAASIC